MNIDKLQQSQDEKKLPLPQIHEDENGESQEVEQESSKPKIKPQGCVWVKPCPANGHPQGCLVCFP